MTHNTQIILTDDLDSFEATPTVTFLFEGVNYEIDVHDEHGSSIEGSSFEQINAVRKTTRGGAATAIRSSSGGRSSSAPKCADLDDVRSWAQENGHRVSDRGRVAGKVLEAYDAAR